MKTPRNMSYAELNDYFSVLADNIEALNKQIYIIRNDPNGNLKDLPYITGLIEKLLAEKKKATAFLRDMTIDLILEDHCLLL